MMVYNKVKNILVGCLNVDEEDIQETSKLITDLGAESIDLLDIQFRLEREFNINIPNHDMFPVDIFKNRDDCVKDGMVTQVGINLLKEKVTTGDFSEWEKTPKHQTISEIFTVKSLVNYVENKLKENGVEP